MRSKQIIEIKGGHHPDSLADNFADKAIEAIEEFDDEIYASVDKSYLKGGKFPEFNVQGYMSFDFRKHDKSYRYELFNHIKRAVVAEFKSIFPEPVIDVKFNLNLEPSNKTQLLNENRFTDTAYVTYSNIFTDKENDLASLAFFIDGLEYIKNDYKLFLVEDKLVINQTFFNSDLEIYNQYLSDITLFISELKTLSDVEIYVNPDLDITGLYFSRYGCSLFYNSTGVVGRGNQWYGFTSPQRYNGETPFGKCRLHPAKYLVNLAKNILTFNANKKEDVVLYAQVGTKLDDYRVIKYN